MLLLLDDLLRRVLMTGVPALQPPAPGAGQPQPPIDTNQVRFDAPDSAWQSYVTNSLKRKALNVHLTDLRENRALRSNQRERTIGNGVIHQQPPPFRVDCHYLLTAWTPAAGALTSQVEPSRDEHRLLSQALAALLHATPLNPARVYGAANVWPAPYENADLPTVLLPVEGFAKLGEFWGAMGEDHRWKPALYLVVTVPVTLLQETSGAMVTTLITEYIPGESAAGEVLIQIGGRVRTPAGDPVAGAWVRIETSVGSPLQTATTDAYGRFSFLGLEAGSYQLSVRVQGLDPKTEPIDVPSYNGKYDVTVP